MKNAIILHGKAGKEEYYDLEQPNGSNAHWLPWLQKQLIGKDIKADTPDAPYSYDPQWELWVKEVERFEIGPDTILIGHSCGGGFWLKYLSLHKDLRVGKVILVAPWTDPDGDETRGFFKDLEIDHDLPARTKGLVIFHSDNDMGNVHKSVAAIRERIDDVDYREFHNYGHFTFDSMNTDKFPELLEECLRV
jgi:predicted alpha/beta hydrolase family esterase